MGMQIHSLKKQEVKCPYIMEVDTFEWEKESINL